MAFGIEQEQTDDALAELAEMSDDELEEFLASRSSGVTDGHLVELCEAYVDQAQEENRDRHKLDDILWEAHENKQREHEQKEDWQARLTTNEPFQTAIQAKALVREAVVDKPEWFYLDVPDSPDKLPKLKGAFWKDTLKYWTKKAKLPEKYADMTEMAFAVGMSHGLKAIWRVNDDGTEALRLKMIEPWKLWSDPDAAPRDPQSGLFKVHEEYIDYHELVEAGKQGRYVNIDRILQEPSDDYPMDQAKDRKKRGLGSWSRNRFRKQVRVREVWGDVLDHNGEMAIPNVRFTVANRTVIKRPTATIFPTLRWPIHQFAALPHLTNFHGVSLIEGMLKMWKLRNNLLCQTADNLNFILNTAYEVDSHKLVNPADTEIYPGAFKHIKANVTGPVYRPIESNKDFLPVVEQLLSITGNLYQNGVFVTELLKGEIGDRKDITLGEVQIKTQQGLGVFRSISKDVEGGGVQALEMIQEVLTTFWDPTDHPSYADVLGPKHTLILSFLQGLAPEDRIALMKQETEISIRGVSQLLQKAEILDRTLNWMKITADPRYAGYVKDYEVLQRSADQLDMTSTIKTPEDLQQEMQGNIPLPGQPFPTGPKGPIAPGTQPGDTGQQLVEAAMARAKVAASPGRGVPA